MVDRTGSTGHLAVAILACDGWIIARRHWLTGGFALATQIAFLIFVGTYRTSPLPAPDLVWQLEGLLEREERPWFEARTLGENPVLLRQSLLQMSAIATPYPQITIVPSHDLRGYASIPEWSRSETR
jgi:hypothetical protein